ncbi:MAG: hypothetical protein [Circoviridae sp.]|nr:MAG: hypothetical protein [Circoviridae sp.]
MQILLMNWLMVNLLLHSSVIVLVLPEVLLGELQAVHDILCLKNTIRLEMLSLRLKPLLVICHTMTLWLITMRTWLTHCRLLAIYLLMMRMVLPLARHGSRSVRLVQQRRHKNSQQGSLLHLVVLCYLQTILTPLSHLLWSKIYSGRSRAASTRECTLHLCWSDHGGF